VELVRTKMEQAQVGSVHPTAESDLAMFVDAVGAGLGGGGDVMGDRLAFADAEAFVPDDMVNADRSASQLIFLWPYKDPVTGESQNHLDLGPDAIAAAEQISALLPPSYELRMTGTAITTSQSLGRSLPQVMASFGVALVLISLLIMVAVRSWTRGLVAMVPNLLPAVLVLGLMGAVGIPVDLLTIVVAGIIIGISVDDTVHITHALFLDGNRTGDLDRDMGRALRSSGPAIVMTSLLIGVGLLSLLVFPVPMLREIGLLGAAAIVLALVADLVVLPALLAASASRDAHRQSSARA
jgi:uncharacterized membrane protein YdfJ with MMPL/SSD domain